MTSRLAATKPLNRLAHLGVTTIHAQRSVRLLVTSRAKPLTRPATAGEPRDAEMSMARPDASGPTPAQRMKMPSRLVTPVQFRAKRLARLMATCQASEGKNARAPAEARKIVKAGHLNLSAARSWLPHPSALLVPLHRRVRCIFPVQQE